MDAAGPPPSGDVTRLLHAARDGDADALDRIIPHVYDELRALAGRQLRRQRPGHTLRPTDLVHESYFKLVRTDGIQAVDRAHFLAIAARAMRQVLVDHARRRLAQKRGGGWVETTLVDQADEIGLGPEELMTLDRALDELDERQRQVVECRFFGGMKESEIAIALGVTVRTVRRDWVKARAWLNRALKA